MKAIFFETINDRLIQVDQREIPDHWGVYKAAVVEPIKAFHSDEELPPVTEKVYKMVAPASRKFPAIFILENIL